MPNKSKIENRKSKMLIWVYPPDNWKSSSHKTFVYGSTDPNARLFVSTDEYLTPERINIFPNGNFAKVIRLPKKRNIVNLIQIINGRKKIVTRHVIARARSARSNPDRLLQVRSGLLRQPFRLPRNDKVIVIDPGHGGKEHGTHSPKGIPEKTFNLQIAKLLFNKLKKHNKNVYLTRSTDKFVSLQKRVHFAKKKRCDLLISIHHNALPDGEDPLKHRGVGVYYTHDFVKLLAKRFLDSISKETYLKRYGIFKRNFFVTRPNFYKGVLIECGFLIHPVEGEIITQRKVQEKIARGIIKALRNNLSGSR